MKMKNVSSFLSKHKTKIVAVLMLIVMFLHNREIIASDYVDLIQSILITLGFLVSKDSTDIPTFDEIKKAEVKAQKIEK